MAKGLIGINVNMVEATMVQSNGNIYFKQVPDNLVGKDEIVSPELLARFLKTCKKNGKIGAKDVALVLPEKNTYFRVINTPVMTDEQIKLNLPYEFKNYVGNDSVKYNYDYYVDEVTKDKDGKATGLRLVAAATLRETTEQYAEIFKRAGLNLVSAIPQEVALINLMKQHKFKKECAVIGVGYEYTNIYMFKGSQLVATKTIEMGCHDIDSSIATEYKVDDYLAASYRDANHKDCLNSDYIKDIYDRISLEIVKTINFYKYENSETEVDVAYFFDLGANNETLIATICNAIGFKRGNVKDLLPNTFKNKKASARCLTSIGATL